MIALLIGLVISTSGVRLIDDRPIEVEVLEINKTGEIRQIILWRWMKLATGNGHHVSQWWTIGDEEPLVIPTGNRFLVYSKGKTFSVRTLHRTETPVDPEMQDRNHLHQSNRTPYFTHPFYNN